MLVRAYTYILAMGGDGLTQASLDAVLSANYLRKQVEGVLDMPHEGPCMHEFVASAHNLAPHGVKALDVAKGLLDRDFYAPTIYFPLVVPEAIMVEPTETESKATLDAFAAAIKEIVEQAEDRPRRRSTTSRTACPSGGSTRWPRRAGSTPICRARARIRFCAGNRLAK